MKRDFTICPNCNKEKKAVGRSYCKKCILIVTRRWRVENREKKAAIQRAYTKTPKGYAVTRASIKKYISKNKEKVKAWRKAFGVAMDPCVICGRTDSVKHHPDYNKPLEIVFLCHLCHKRVHAGEINCPEPIFLGATVVE